ncbi:hypothetical protein J3R82DRAFT_4797 [Butyriboletus roseoflavus]|nr:hypothetical protein J3R82DRAFT_4797 [Butyriboletus roseoflavus]
MLQSLTPSKAAKSRQYFTIQFDAKRIHDCCCAVGCPVDTVAPPIQLFNKAFTCFSSKASDPEYNVPDDFVLNTWTIMAKFALINIEEDCHHGLSQLLQTAINHPLTSHTNPDGTGPDSMAMSSCRSLQGYLMINKEKNEFGDRRSDPSIQATFLFQRTFSQVMTSLLHPISSFVC